jgi:hypothetical protein
MDEDRRVVRWQVPGSPRTLWHVDDPVPADRLGRTACGLRYQRGIVEADSGNPDLVVCQNCERALREVTPPAHPVE